MSDAAKFVLFDGKGMYNYVIVINYSDFGVVEINCKVGKCNCFLYRN